MNTKLTYTAFAATFATALSLPAVAAPSTQDGDARVDAREVSSAKDAPIVSGKKKKGKDGSCGEGSCG